MKESSITIVVTARASLLSRSQVIMYSSQQCVFEGTFVHGELHGEITVTPAGKSPFVANYDHGAYLGRVKSTVVKPPS